MSERPVPEVFEVPEDPREALELGFRLGSHLVIGWVNAYAHATRYVTQWVLECPEGWASVPGALEGIVEQVEKARKQAQRFAERQARHNQDPGAN
jgi:hypothetical protein